MTLPQGYNTFADGNVLSADEINGYLQQGVLVFDDEADRTTQLTGSLREGMYAYLKSDGVTYVYDGSTWQRVGKQDVETEKNFQAFTGSGGTTVPAWATKMYYLVVRGGNNGTAGTTGSFGGAGGAGGQVLQGNTAVTGGTSITVTVGGAASNSSVAISGGSTFTASSTGAAANTNGTSPSAPFAIGVIAGGGGAGGGQDVSPGQAGGTGGSGTGGRGGEVGTSRPATAGYPADPNRGGGGGGGGSFFAGAAGGAGGSGLVLLYFS